MVSSKTLSKLAADEPVNQEELNESRIIIRRNKTLSLENLKNKEEFLKKLSEVTEGYVGADIESVCREAATLALRENIDSREILPKHFEQALEKVRPSVTKEVQQTYEELRDTLTASRAKQMLDEKPGYMG